MLLGAPRQYLPSVKVLLSVYGIWNLDFFRPYYSDLCLGIGILPTLALDYAIIDNIGSRMDWKRDHVRALNQHKPCRSVRVARELQLPMLYWPILWKFGGKELTDLLTLACM